MGQHVYRVSGRSSSQRSTWCSFHFQSSSICIWSSRCSSFKKLNPPSVRVCSLQWDAKRCDTKQKTMCFNPAIRWPLTPQQAITEPCHNSVNTTSIARAERPARKQNISQRARTERGDGDNGDNHPFVRTNLLSLAKAIFRGPGLPLRLQMIDILINWFWQLLSMTHVWPGCPRVPVRSIIQSISLSGSSHQSHLK